MQTRQQDTNEGIEMAPLTRREITYTLPRLSLSEMPYLARREYTLPRLSFSDLNVNLDLNILTQVPTVTLLPQNYIQQQIDQYNQGTQEERNRFISQSRPYSLLDIVQSEGQQLVSRIQTNNTNTFYMDPNGTAHRHPRNEERDPDMSLDSAPTP